MNLVLVSNDHYRVAYATSSNRWYALETVSNLTGAAWAEDLPASPGSGATDTLTRTNALNRGFYRVRAELP